MDVFLKVIHTLSTSYPQVIHRLSTISKKIFIIKQVLLYSYLVIFLTVAIQISLFLFYASKSFLYSFYLRGRDFYEVIIEIYFFYLVSFWSWRSYGLGR